jgi:hypothetical protein
MKLWSTTLPSITAMLIGVIPVFGQAVFAAAGGEYPTIKSTGAAVTGSALPSETPTDSNSSPLTLFIEGPTGNTFRLIYLPTEGWKFASAVAGAKPAERALTLTAMPPSDERSELADPLTVFIDGPTGFTYVWIRDAGWKFVGRIANGG